MAEKEIKVDLVAETSDIDRGMDKAAESINKLGKAANNAGRDFDASSNKIQQSAKRARDSISGMVSAMNGLAAAATVGAIGSVASGIVSMGVSAIKASAQMKQYEIAFSTMLGSAEKGKAMLADLQKFAAETPFDVQGVTKAAQQLLAFGFNAKEIIPTLRTLGDTAAGLSKGAEGVQQIAYALGQIKTSGTLKTQDMNQLATAGIGSWEMLAQAAGKSIDEVRAMTEKGMIDSATAIEVITQGMNDSFGGMMAKTAEEITGLWSNVTETAATAQATIGTYLADSLDVKGVLKTIAKDIGGVTDALAEAQKQGKSFREALQDAIPTPFIAAIGAASAVIGTTLVAATAAATTAMAGLIGVSLPVIGAVAAIGAVVATVALYWDDISDAATAAMRSVEQAVQEGFGVFASIATRAMEAALSDVLWFADKGASGIEWMFNTIMGYCPDWVTSIRDAFDEALQAIHAWADNAIAAIAEVLSAKEQVEASAGGAPAETAPTPPERKPTKHTGPVDLTGGRTPKRSGGGGGGGTSRAKKSEEADMKRREQELKRVTEALAKAKNATTDLRNTFADMQADIDFAVLSGSDAVFGAITKEKNARLRAIDEVLAKQKNAIAEAEKMRRSAEATGDARAVESAKALIAERKELNKQSMLEAKEMRAQIEQQAYDESIRLETALNAAKADMNEALNAATHEQFLEYLESGKTAQLTALQEEMAYRQQLLDWRAESERTMLDFSIEAADALKNQLSSGLADIITQGGTLAEVFKNITQSIANMFIEYMVNKKLAAALDSMLNKKNEAEATSAASANVAAAVQKSIAELGPVAGPIAYSTAVSTMMSVGLGSMAVKKAQGGIVYGAGTSTSDSIPAMLSNGEYVVRAAAVRKIGLPMLNAINAGRGFADGGIVSASAFVGKSQSPVKSTPVPANVNFSITAMDASGFSDFLRNGGLDEIKQALVDNDRNFASAAGVW